MIPTFSRSPIHPEGLIFALFSGILTVLLWYVFTPFGVAGLLITLWVLAFFRNPQRVVPQIDGAIVSPADGTICAITPNVSAPEGTDLPGKEWTRVCVFMDVFNVHVNRMPISGEVTYSAHKPGKFFDARLDKASTDNEQQIIVVEDKKAKLTIPFVQVAGLIARRIRCDAKKGQKVSIGEVFGLIRFGSRVDVYLPSGIEPQVIKGQTIIAGETILANAVTQLPQPKGIER